MPEDKDHRCIAFHIQSSETSLRLLELSPALLSTITSADAPELYLKASGLSSSSTGANTVLCTDKETFQLRQVQSSNSVFIVQGQNTLGQDSGDIITQGHSDPILTAISRCSSTLELLPSQELDRTMLQSYLNVYIDLEDAERKVTRASTANDQKTRSQLIDDVPVSAAQFETLWTSTCAFEWKNLFWVPTSPARLSAWKHFLELALMNDINLAKPIEVEKVIGLTDADEQPQELVIAVLKTLAQDLSVPEDLSKSAKGHIHLDQKKCVQWTGLALLETLPSINSMSATQLTQSWLELLPENWKNAVSLPLLDERILRLDNGMICDRRAAALLPDDVTSASKPGLARSTSNRKWHDKFKASRKQ